MKTTNNERLIKSSINFQQFLGSLDISSFLLDLSPLNMQSTLRKMITAINGRSIRYALSGTILRVIGKRRIKRSWNLRRVIRKIGKEIVWISFWSGRKTLRILLRLRLLHESTGWRIISTIVRRSRINRHIRMHLLVVKVTMIEVHVIVLVVVNFLSFFMADGLSLLWSSQVIVSQRTDILSPFVFCFISSPAVFFTLLGFSELCHSMCISALSSLSTRSFLKTETNLCLVKPTNKLS